MHVCEIHVYEMPVYNMHVHEMHTYEKYTLRDVRLLDAHACETYAYELRAYEMHDSDMHEFVAVRCLFRFSPPDQALRLSRRFATLKVPFPPRPPPSLHSTLLLYLSPLRKCYALVLRRAQLSLFRDPISRNLITDFVSFS